MLYTPYTICLMLHLIILSIDSIFIVTTDVICLSTPHLEPHRIYAYLSITHPQFRNSAAHYAHLSLLASHLLFRFIPTPHLIIQLDGTILPYLT